MSDLRQRLKNTRWSYQIAGTNWDAGTDMEYLSELVNYWQDACDWRAHEAALNQFAHFKTELDGAGIILFTSAEKGRIHFRYFSRTDIPIRFTDLQK